MSDITVLFTTHSSVTHALQDADATPVGTLYVNGTADAATVTETDIGVGMYTIAVTLPAPTVGDVRELYVAATVDGIADGGVIWSDTYAADVTLAATQGSYAPAQAGDAMTLTPAYDRSKDDVLTPLATVDGKADTLLTRIVGTLLTGNHSPQSGDGYAVVNNATYGNAALLNIIGNGGALTVTHRVVLDTDGDTTPDSPAVGIEGVRCILTSDAAGNTQVGAVKYTDSQGYVYWRGLVTGTYYVWREKGGYSFTDPASETPA